MSNQKYKIGTIVYNKQKQAFKILDIIYTDKYPRFVVQSERTGYTREIARSTLYAGKYKDKLDSQSSFKGIIGYVNTSDFPREYRVWSAMLRRCNDKKHDSYKYYGEKGITVSERWHRFDLFLEDLSKIDGYEYNLFQDGKIELDKDIRGGRIYSLENCIFVSPTDNNNNTSRQRLFKITLPNGEELFHNNKKEVAKKYDLDDSGICKCLNHGKSNVKGYKFEYIDNAND